MGETKEASTVDAVLGYDTEDRGDAAGRGIIGSPYIRHQVEVARKRTGKVLTTDVLVDPTGGGARTVEDNGGAANDAPVASHVEPVATLEREGEIGPRASGKADATSGSDEPPADTTDVDAVKAYLDSHNVEQVNAWLSRLDGEDRQRVVTVETQFQSRKTITG